MPLSIKSYIVCNLLLKLSGRGMENILLELAVHEIHEYKFRIGFLLLCIHYSVFWREGEGGKLNIILPSVHLKSSLIRVMAFDESGLRRVELLCTIFREFHGSFQTTKKTNAMIMLHHIYIYIYRLKSMNIRNHENCNSSSTMKIGIHDFNVFILHVKQYIFVSYLR
jgi:hypothetical protein